MSIFLNYRILISRAIKSADKLTPIGLKILTKEKDPTGRTYYWLTGSFQNFDKGNDTDEWALANGYVSIVPVQYDITAYDCISELKSWGL